MKNKPCNVENCNEPAEYVDEERQVFVCEKDYQGMMQRTPDGMEAFKKIQQPKSGIIIFEENLTLEGLQRLKQEAENYPVKADTKETYKLVYEQHQRFKRLHVAVRKKAEDLIKTAKSDFEAERDKINADLQFVLDVIEPIRDKLETARTDYEAAEKEEKERLAREEAERQQAELKRQQEEQARLEAERLAEQEAERQRIADEAAKIEAEKTKLERERYEFECEKSRLDFDAAWDEAYPGKGLQNTGFSWDDEQADPLADIDSLSNEYKENSHIKPKPVILTDDPIHQKSMQAQGFDCRIVDDATVEGWIESKKVKIEKIDTDGPMSDEDKEAVEKADEYFNGERPAVSQEELDALLDDKPEDVVTPVNFGVIAQDKEHQERLKEFGIDAGLIDDLPISEGLKSSPEDRQPERIDSIKESCNLLLGRVQNELEIGFESQPITDHLYNFAQVLDGFINTFPEEP